MNYVKHGFNMTDAQKRSIKRALGKNAGLTLLFKKNQLSGKDYLMLPPQVVRKIAKNKAKGMGIRIQLSQTAIRKNRQGGFILPLLTAAITPAIKNSIATLAEPTEGTNKIQRRLAHLRGKGVSKAFAQGAQLAEKPMIKRLVEDVDMNQPGAKKEVMSRLKEVGAVGGKGMSGAGPLSDLWEGFKFGFTNPIGGIELLIREASGKGCGCQNGGGLTFY
jgi:hypothetical protein